jgi:hypothetical protein
MCLARRAVDQLMNWLSGLRVARVGEASSRSRFLQAARRFRHPSITCAFSAASLEGAVAVDEQIGIGPLAQVA